MERINLSDHQQNIADKIVEWLKTDKQCFAVSGHAGTGKTTVGRWLQEEIGGASFCAYTNKAVNVLRGKGCREVSTIHSAIYEPAKRDKSPLDTLKVNLEDAKKSGNQMEVTILEKKVEDLEEELAKPHFKKREQEIKPFKIIDEYSMINQEVYKHLCETYEKLLFFGDEFQLSPIGKTSHGEDSYCPIVPDAKLTEIHRQAEDSPILHAATLVRNMCKPQFCDWGGFRFVNRWDLPDADLLAAEQVICGHNKTRHMLNDWFRQRKGITDPLPRKGESMMCLTNLRQLGLFNGMTVEVSEDAIPVPGKPWAYLAKFKNINRDLIDGERPLECWLGELKGEIYRHSDLRLRGLRKFTFDHAITCHKSQGSEYETLVVYNEPVGDNELEKQRWLYTAITRGKKMVTLVQP